MKLKVIKEFSTDVFTHLLSEDEPNLEKEIFNVGDIIDVDVIEENDDTFIEIQFPDGSMVYQLPKKHFVELPE